MYYADEMAIKLELKKVIYNVDLMRLRYLMGERESQKQVRRIRESLKLVEGYLRDIEERS